MTNGSGVSGLASSDAISGLYHADASIGFDTHPTFASVVPDPHLAFASVVSDPFLGVTFALAAALAFAVQFLCVRIGTRDGDVVGVVLVSLLCNVALVVPLVVLFYPLSFEALFTPLSLLSFALAGIFGSLLARLLMFKSIEVIGASRTSPIVSSNVFFATALAVVFLGERLTASHFAGIVLVVGGVTVISWETATSEPDRPLREVGLSLVLPLLAAAAIGVEPIFVSMGLAEGTPVLPGVAIKVSVATVSFAAYVAVYRSSLRIPVRDTIVIWYLGAGLTSAIGIVSYFAALELAPVVTVVPILQTTPLLVAGLSAIFLPQHIERVTPRLVGAALIVVVGATLVSLS